MVQNQKIQLLSPDIVNQIAAGEVVDRPAHMVKELCENSIDAGATDLQIHFQDGGRCVRISDNGAGISREDLLLAITRHATSKIEKTDDLWSISSYGFRGEALASIGAVSQLTIESRVQGTNQAHKIESRFGVYGDAQECGGDFGTRIDVKDLFANVPARLKFLKSDAAEGVAIKTQIKALGMANPQVTFRVYQGSEMQFYWPRVETQLDRIRQVFDLEELFIGENKINEIKASVVMASPNETLKTSKNIWLFVRGRYILDRSLQTAVLEGYRNYLMHGEFPQAAIFIDCDPGTIDVNVSPTKSQVKFQDAQSAFRSVHHAVRGVLEKAPWLNSLLPHTPAGIETAVHAFSANYDTTQATTTLTFDAPELTKSQYQQKVAFITRKDLSTQEIAAFTERGGASNLPLWSNLQIIGQAHLTYIVAQKSDSILFIDQHAAHERVLFEKFSQSHLKNNIEVQNLLLPVVISIPEEAISNLLKQQTELSLLGIHFEQMGPAQIAVFAYPVILKSESLSPLFTRIANEIVEFGDTFQFQKLTGEILSTMACHSAIRAGQALSVQEMKEMLVLMDDYPQSSFCPHGRPVFVEYPIQKLEKDFGRIV